jgi:GYF domain 2
MAEAWFIRVEGKEYGPADVETLREWRTEGRVLPTNEARPAGVDLWVTAAEIPGLFEPPPLPIDAAAVASAAAGVVQAALQPQRSFGHILGDTFRIYGRGFFQYLFLTLLVALPSVCAQLSGSAVTPGSAESPDIGAALAGLFAFAMFVLSLAAWPIFIAGVQIVTAEFAAGRRPRVVDLLGTMLKFWPRVAGLCIFVYGIFFLLIVLAVGIMVMLVAGASSFAIILLALGLFVIQVWMFGRFFVNVLFWQQFAVFENLDFVTTLRQSKALARSGRDLPWHQRPVWRGIIISSLWLAFVFAMNIGSEWPAMRESFHVISTSTDPQAMIDSLRASAQSSGFSLTSFSLGLLQTVLRPLLGIAFVITYLDSTQRPGRDNSR